MLLSFMSLFLNFIPLNFSDEKPWVLLLAKLHCGEGIEKGDAAVPQQPAHLKSCHQGVGTPPKL